MELHKDSMHDHYWVEDGKLYETYETIRGLRYRYIGNVPNHPDCDRLTEGQIEKIISEY